MYVLDNYTCVPWCVLKLGLFIDDVLYSAVETAASYRVIG